MFAWDDSEVWGVEWRAFLRFSACEEDLSHESPDALLPDAVVKGAEPSLVVPAVAGG
jgi:molybdopterin synthase sulfur carrier subunit